MTKEKARDIMKAGISRVVFSIDSPDKKVYESIRKGLNFDCVVSNTMGFIHMAKDCDVEVHMVVRKDNEAQMGRMKSMWPASCKVSFGPDDGRGGEDRTGPYKTLYTDMPCECLWNTLYVLSDGIAVMCCQDWSGKVPLGDVFEDGIEKVWNGQKFKAIRVAHKRGLKRSVPVCSICETTY
jgi:MoaA/NifB/PqqE/SkfB family radical SAM enzyme